MKKRYTYNEIVDRFGKDVADKAISTGAEPTSCVVDPLHEGLSLWAEAPIEIDGYIIRAYYYLTEEDEQNLDFFDWEEKAEFEVEEIKDDPDSIYPMFEVSNNHVTYYSVQRQESVCITDMKIKAVIY